MEEIKETATSSAVLKPESCTMKNVAALKDNLVALLKENDAVEIVMDGVTKPDLSCLQLLCSAHRFATEKGKKLSLKDQEGLLQNKLEIAGFTTGECPFNKNHDCLWNAAR